MAAAATMRTELATYMIASEYVQLIDMLLVMSYMTWCYL